MLFRSWAANDGFGPALGGFRTSTLDNRTATEQALALLGEGGMGRVFDAFDRLLNAIESFAASQDCQVLEVGVNLSRIEAYQAMLQSGFRTLTQGVAMHRPNQPLYNRPGVYVLDDWR